MIKLKEKRILIIWLVKILIVATSIMVTTKINLSLVATLTLIIVSDGMMLLLNVKRGYREWIHVAYVFLLAVNSIFELNGEYRYTVVISQLVLFLAYFVISNIEMQEIEEK